MNIATIQIPSHARCLIVEDAEVRLDWFLAKLPSSMTAVTPQEAIMILDISQDFDVVFLDHDCAGSYFVDPADPEFLNKSFWRVAQYLHRTEFKGLVVIHSGNPVGAKRMEALLSSVCKVAVLPFGSFDIEVF
jgi:NAD+-processing family protein with receiver domain